MFFEANPPYQWLVVPWKTIQTWALFHIEVMGKVPINLFKPSKARGLSGLSTLYWNSQTQRHGDHLKIEGKGRARCWQGFPIHSLKLIVCT